jgi:non-ribosomal peptide synthetase component F
LRYADYAYWQRERLGGELLEKLNAHWKQKLTGAPTSLRLPFDFERPKLLKYTGERIHFSARGDLPARLKRVAIEENATLFMGVLAAFKSLLLYYSGQDDVVVGSPINGRERPELEGLIGFFSNTLVMRTRLDGDPSFQEAIRRVRSTVLEAHAHHELPFSSVVAAVGNPRIMNQNPLFQVNFRLRNIPQSDPAMAGLTVEPLDIHNGRAKFELAFELWESPDGLTGFTEFSTELFKKETIEAMVATFVSLLDMLVSSPDAPLSESFTKLRAG